MAGTKNESRVVWMRFEHKNLIDVAVEFVHELPARRIPHLDEMIILGGYRQGIVAIPRHHGHTVLSMNIQAGELLERLLLERLGRVEQNVLPALRLVPPDLGGAVLAAAHETRRVVGELDAVDKICVRLELGDAYGLLVVVVEEVDADEMIVAARRHKRTTRAKR